MISIPVSIGEIIDKLSILQVKKNMITDEEKLTFVNKEFDLLNDLSSDFLSDSEIYDLYNKLCITNTKLWNIEDELRVLEKNKSFGDDFVELARSVYFTNDERFELKNKINQKTNSSIKEIKEYVNYKQNDTKY
jgi:predicted transglutaminase-like cysteine proteinase